MLLKILLLCLTFSTFLLGAEPWYKRLSSNIDAKIEAGIYLPDSDGEISNPTSDADINRDFGYSTLRSSFFSLELRVDYDFVPNIDIEYFKMQDRKDVDLNSSLKIADGTFNAKPTTNIDYDVLKFTMYQEFKIKGKRATLLNRPYYTGDLEFNIGATIKHIGWRFDIKQGSDASWITVDEFILLPYLGIRYYRYDLTIHAKVNTLSFGDAESRNFYVGADYRVVAGVYLSAGYMFEQFKALERNDTVDFDTSGYKFSFKYAF